MYSIYYVIYDSMIYAMLDSFMACLMAISGCQKCDM